MLFWAPILENMYIKTRPSSISKLSPDTSDCGSPSGAGFYAIEEDGDMEKYHSSRVIQDFVLLSGKRGCFRCISLQVYNI